MIARVDCLVFGVALACGSPALAWEIKHPVYKADLKGLDESTVAPYLSWTEAELRESVSEKSAVEPSNMTMKQVVYDLARMYSKTGERRYAEKAVILLERFAEVAPLWPYVSRDRKTIVPAAQCPDWGKGDAGGLWGGWFYVELEKAKAFALAYDFIAGSGEIERRSGATGKPIKRLVEDELLRYVVDFQLMFSKHDPGTDGIRREEFAFTNMDGHGILSLIVFGKVVEPAYVHIAARWLRLFPSVAYFRDGMWHEGSPAYHEQITGRLRRSVAEIRGYSDPAGYACGGYRTRFGKLFPGDGQRFDDFDVTVGREAQFDRMAHVLEPLILPDGYYLGLHESGVKNSYRKRNQSEPKCLFGARHAVLGRFSGNDQVQAHLHFGGTDGHEHFDCLNLVLWARGGELLSDGEYRAIGERNSRRWNMSTAGHNTVVVDEKNQRASWDDLMTLTADDAVDEVGFYKYQDFRHGNTKHFGNLRLWDAAQPHLQVVEAEGENSYLGSVSLYRRTIAMVEIEGADFYLVDIFRVKGGTTHDWMLHGRLQEDYGFQTDLRLRTQAAATRHGFLRVDRTAVTGSTWHVEFQYENGARLQTVMLGRPGTEVGVGKAPAMRRDGTAVFVDVRRKGGDSCFVAVHEPHSGTPKVKSVVPLVYGGAADAPVVLKVELEGERVDYVASTLDEPPYPEHGIPEAGMRFKGRFAHVALEGEHPKWMYLLEGRSLRVKEVSLSAARGDFSYRGDITGIARREAGSDWNGFVTNAVLPPGEVLKGRTLLLTLPDGRTEGYTIARVDQDRSAFRIAVEEEPGIELRDRGRLVKLVYYPWHGLRGQRIRFLVPGCVYRDGSGQVASTAPLGPAGQL